MEDLLGLPAPMLAYQNRGRLGDADAFRVKVRVGFPGVGREGGGLGRERGRGGWDGYNMYDDDVERRHSFCRPPTSPPTIYTPDTPYIRPLTHSTPNNSKKALEWLDDPRLNRQALVHATALLRATVTASASASASADGSGGM